ncbi:MAG: 4-(cytidine 5'-diphospho)-2-C-methyl-D-erythritol kinase [Candidatus Rokubacteria bacterium]|nr:4-(cytidine 5'-diphospho)-2-C-methyl-D-erythritol kinase [Candidatus Rokubacteria bacterium]
MIRFYALSRRSRAARSLTLRTSAKVNLVLEVLGKRPDGYHELSTVLQAVDLFDRLVLEEDEALTLRTSDPDLPTDEANLVVRAARLIREAAGVSRGARITLDKQIPVAAGLGGGSSDAAATLWGLAQLWGLGWGGERLAEMAAELGMDVPFFLHGGRALATGRGERLRPLPAAPAMSLVLVKPRFPLSTREVYGRVPPGLRDDGARTGALIRALASRDSSRVAACLYNALEVVVGPAYPEISRIKRALLGAGALGSVMSGSGPTVLALARSAEHARQLRSRVTTTAWSAWAVRTLAAPAIRAVK